MHIYTHLYAHTRTLVALFVAVLGQLQIYIRPFPSQLALNLNFFFSNLFALNKISLEISLCFQICTQVAWFAGFHYYFLGGNFIMHSFVHSFIICVRIVEVKFKVTLIRLRVGVLFLILIVYFLHFSIFLLLFFSTHVRVRQLKIKVSYCILSLCLDIFLSPPIFLACLMQFVIASFLMAN